MIALMQSLDAKHPAACHQITLSQAEGDLLTLCKERQSTGMAINTLG